MVRKIFRVLSRVMKNLFMEVIIKYLLCYIFAALAYLVSLNVNSLQMEAVTLNIASSLISLPLVFIVYDLYSRILMYKSTKLINQVVDKEVNDIFLKFIFFTTYFYHELRPELERDIRDLDKELNKDQEIIFEEISKNVHPGFFLFSIFDEFDSYIKDILNANTKSQYIRIQEIAVLQEFNNLYRDFKSCFSWIEEDDFIKHKKIMNIELTESNFTKSSNENEIFYDVVLIKDEQSKVPFYCAKYRLFDEDALTYLYKFSGNKAKEISSSIYKLYNCINKWKKLRNVERLTFENGLVSCGRLYLDENLTFNDHMKQNISIHGTF